MKKSILMLAAGALLLATPSCKKGENDPFMSLSSRTARLAGTWDVTAGSWTDVQTYSWGGTDYTQTDVYTYDGTNLTVVSTTASSGGSITDPANTVPMSMSMTFDKDGSYSSSTTYDGEVSTEAGYWAFSGKSKAQELKKKEAVIISLTESVSNGNKTTYTGTALGADNTLMLDELKGKEMIIKIDNKTTWSDATYSSSLGTWTLTAK